MLIILWHQLPQKPIFYITIDKRDYIVATTDIINQFLFTHDLHTEECLVKHGDLIKYNLVPIKCEVGLSKWIQDIQMILTKCVH